MNKLKLFSLFAAVMFAASMWATDPMGAIDGLLGKNGSFRVWGWAIDPDDGNYKVTIHVYVYTSATATNAIKSYNAGAANLYRSDLESLGYGTMHGYDFNLSLTDLNPGTYYIRVFALNNVSSQNNPALPYSGDVYVQAVTVSSPYTVSYDANGGTGAPSAQKKGADVTITLSSTTPTRTGYTFNGWNTNSSGTGTNYAKGATYSANASATLYAKWTANTYTVTLDRQNGTGGSASATATYAAAMPSITVPTRTGYTFNGYYTEANGKGTKYYNANGTSAKNWDKTAATTLYAYWTVNTYTVTLDLQGGQTGSTQVTATYDAAMPSMTVPTRKGFTFAGYYDAKTGGTKYYNADGSSARTWNKASNTTLYAHWTLDPSTQVAYLDSLGQLVAQENVAFNRPEAPEVEGFTFLYWMVKEAPLSEGIKLQAIYAEDEPSSAPKKQVGKFTLIRKEGAENEYILQTAK